MILATHALVGAAVAQAFPGHPVIGFCAGFFSHFILDAIPHWEYALHTDAYLGSTTKKKKWTVALYDMLRVSCDAQIGILLALLFIWDGRIETLGIVFIGIVAGILPDALQMAWMILPRWPLTLLQKFHKRIHADPIWENSPLVGIVSQLFIIGMAFSLTTFL